jgi:mannan endo-1,4-beta-mannosidase
VTSFPRALRLFNRALLVGAALLAAPPAGADDFVHTRGADFVLGDRSFRFVGVNAAAMHGPERARAAETIAAAAAEDLTVVRLWALGEGDRESETWRRDDFLFRIGPDGWVDRAFEQLDLVVDAAHRANVRLVVVLSNSWRDYGGVPEYLKWLGFRNPDVYGFEDRFYEDPRAFAEYEKHVRRVVGRTNARSGIAYADDPAILSWELMNESHVSRTGVAAQLAWTRRAAALVHSLDPNHLVTLGHVGYRVAAERDAWIAIHEAPEIDYCDHHLYLEEQGGIRRLRDLYDRIDDRAQLARFVVRKPLVLGEVGFDNQASRWLGLSRAELHERVVDHALDDGVSGVLAWIYLPPGIERRRFPIQWGTDRHADLRAALRRAAAHARAEPRPNPRLGESVGRAYLYPRFSIAGRPGNVVAGGARGRTLEFDVPAMAFHRARWEAFGTWDRERPAHAYGAQSGFFDYAIAVPRGTPSKVEIAARVSSEFPGRFAPPDGSSRVRVSIGGAPVGEWTVIPDDGRGRTERLASTDPAVLAALEGGVADVRFEVADDPSANGLCVYDPGLTVKLGYGTAP